MSDLLYWASWMAFPIGGALLGLFAYLVHLRDEVRWAREAKAERQHTPAE